MEAQNEQMICINFIADINEKTAGLLIFLLTEQLRAGVNNYRINISSNGGLVFHSVAIYNFLNGLKDVNIHTHNLGQIDSAANLIFLTGHTRTASKASTFLLHPPQMTLQGNAGASFSIEFLNERLQSIIKDQSKMAEIIADKIGKKKSEVIRMFKSRKTYSSLEAKQLGMIQSIEEFVAKPGMPIFSITNQT